MANTESEARISKGMTPYPSKYLVLEAATAFTGARYAVDEGERRHIRYGYETPDVIPELVVDVREGRSIDWGGAVIMPAGYRVLFDGPGPLPAELLLPKKETPCRF